MIDEPGDRLAKLFAVDRPRDVLVDVEAEDGETARVPRQQPDLTVPVAGADPTDRRGGISFDESGVEEHDVDLVVERVEPALDVRRDANRVRVEPRRVLGRPLGVGIEEEDGTVGVARHSRGHVVLAEA
ncbi:hypothetical protein EXE53_18480 [Halorubrum sp. SD626R]|nr:hypothetical protein EXE53_18480 [Halorubrum sp. SD626R]